YNDAQYVSVEALFGAVEGGVAGKFRFSRIGDLSGSLTVNYSPSTTGTSGTDFTALSGTVTFLAGEATADVTVTAADDYDYDPDETVTATVTGGTGYSVGAENEASLLISDSIALTFTIDSKDGAIWYVIPLDQVDAAQASQNITPTAFNLNIDGHDFTYGS